MVLKEFIAEIQGHDGRRYEITVPARKESDAERMLRNLFDTLSSLDTIISVKPADRDDNPPSVPPLP